MDLCCPHWLTDFSRGLRNLQEQGLFCDVVIQTAECETYSAHANVLAAASPILSTYMQDSGLFVKFDEISAQTWQRLLEFMYTGKVFGVPPSDAHLLYEAARKLGIDTLTSLIDSQPDIKPHLASTEQGPPTEFVKDEDDDDDDDDESEGAMEDEDNDAETSTSGNPHGYSWFREFVSVTVENEDDVFINDEENKTNYCRTNQNRPIKVNHDSGRGLNVQETKKDETQECINPCGELDIANKENGDLKATDVDECKVRKSKRIKLMPSDEKGPFSVDDDTSNNRNMIETIGKKSNSKSPKGKKNQNVHMYSQREPKQAKKSNNPTQNDSDQGNTDKCDANIHQCDICNISFLTLAALEHHADKDTCKSPAINKREYKNWKKLQCESRPGNRSCDAQKLILEDPSEPTCCLCHQTFTTVNLLGRHARRCHPDSEIEALGARHPSSLVQCPVCAQEHPRRRMVEHLWTQHEVQVAGRCAYYACADCEYRTVRGELYRRHVDSAVHGRARRQHHVCAVCGKGFVQSASLRAHMAVHTGERSFPCRFCERRFRKQSARDQHEPLHTGYKPYACCRCHARFTQITSTNVHLARYHPEVPRSEWRQNRSYQPMATVASRDQQTAQQGDAGDTNGGEDGDGGTNGSGGNNEQGDS